MKLNAKIYIMWPLFTLSILSIKDSVAALANPFNLVSIFQLSNVILITDMNEAHLVKKGPPCSRDSLKQNLTTKNGLNFII